MHIVSPTSHWNDINKDVSPLLPLFTYLLQMHHIYTSPSEVINAESFSGNESMDLVTGLLWEVEGIQTTWQDKVNLIEVCFDEEEGGGRDFVSFLTYFC